MASFGADEAFLHSFVNERQQGIVVSIYIQQPHLPKPSSTSLRNYLSLSKSFKIKKGPYWFIMDAKLSPSYDLKNLLKCPIATFTHKQDTLLLIHFSIYFSTCHILKCLYIHKIKFQY